MKLIAVFFGFWILFVPSLVASVVILRALDATWRQTMGNPLDWDRAHCDSGALYEQTHPR